MVEILCFIMSGKRKKDDSEAIGIMKSTEILLVITSSNYLRENLKQKLSLDNLIIMWVSVT